MYIKVWMHAAQDQYQGTPLLSLRVLDSCCFRKLLEHKSRQIVEVPRSCSWPGRRAGRTPSFCQINLNFCNPSGGQLSFVNSHSTRPRKCGQDKGGSWPFLFSVWRINGWLSSYLLKNPFTVKRSSELKSPGDFCFDVCFSAGHLNWKLGNFLFTSSTTIFYRSLNW